MLGGVLTDAISWRVGFFINLPIGIALIVAASRFLPETPAGLAATTIGMFWLSRLSADTSYLTGVALPMILIGAGQGASLGPLTAAGIAGVRPRDAGAASGLVNVAHQDPRLHLP